MTVFRFSGGGGLCCAVPPSLLLMVMIPSRHKCHEKLQVSFPTLAKTLTAPSTRLLIDDPVDRLKISLMISLLSLPACIIIQELNWTPRNSRMNTDQILERLFDFGASCSFSSKSIG